MKLILTRSPQLLFYKMKSKKEDKNMTTDTITISYNYNVKWKDTIRKKSCRKVNTWNIFGGRVDDFGTQGVVKFRSLVKKRKIV